jgi:Domain of unknown function (DUF929)
MAKTKQRSTPAAQRREQLRQQRQKSSQAMPVQSQARKRSTQQRKSSRNTWLLIGGVVVAIALVVGVFIYLSNQQSNSNFAQGSTDPAVFKAVTTVSSALLSQAGTGGVQNPFNRVPAGTPVLKGPTGKPEIFYYGAEFCPYCAAQRWSMVVALSRFGTFDKLPQITSSSTDVYPNTSTFTFLGSKYTSSYIDFVPLENEDRNGNPLQQPTPAEQQLLTKFNVQGYPFIDIANLYTIAGPMYDPGVLSGLSHQAIANQLSDPSSTVARNILGSANYLTAAICAATQNQPASVCTASPIPSIEQSLPKSSTSLVPAGIHLGTVATQFDMVLRQDE